MHVHLAELLDKWAMDHPEPYVGPALAAVTDAWRLQPNLQPNGVARGGTGRSR